MSELVEHVFTLRRVQKRIDDLDASIARISILMDRMNARLIRLNAQAKVEKERREIIAINIGKCEL